MGARSRVIALALLLSVGVPSVGGQVKGGKTKQGKGDPGAVRPSAADTSLPSFKNDVFPILKIHCLPCHSEEQMNPSELYLESYEGLMNGGKHGKAVVPGNADSSLLVQKLREPPPFGDLMPLKSKNPLSPDSIRILGDWIAGGAKDN